MARIPPDAGSYHRATLILEDALKATQDPPGQAVDGDPQVYAQTLAAIGLGEAMLALCDELRNR